MSGTATRIIAILAALSALALLVFSWIAGAPNAPADARFAACQANSVGGGAIGGAFALVDENGSTVTDKDMLTKPSLIYFGYTFCPDVCPYDAARNAEAVSLLKERGMELGSLFITVDPERDTPEQLKEWTDLLSPDLVGLTGTAEQIKTAADAYKVIYRKHEDEGEYYLVDHTAFTYLMMPRADGLGAEFADFFRREDTAAIIADRAACYLEAAGQPN